MSKILIRPFAIGEGKLYRDLRLKALADSPDAFGRTLAEEQDRADAEWSQRIVEWTNVDSRLALVALLDDRAVGLAFVRLLPETHDVAQLFSMWVDPTARQVGIGGKLIAATIDWSRARGVRKIKLQVTENNVAAVRVYQRAGFVPTLESEVLRPGSPLTARTMELTL